MRLGIALGEKGRSADAADCFRAAIRLDPKPAVRHFNLGLALARLDRYEEAARSCEEALRRDPGHALACYLLAMASYRLKRYDDSARHYAAAFDSAPERLRNMDDRYNAACAAALCTEDRDRWRRQALEWLRADLEGKREQAKPADLVRMLTHWLVDPDLAGVRDGDALAKLPAAERAEWEALWDSVRQALEEAREED
jgi:tetratricopeptide (TPR) repeat protein